MTQAELPSSPAADRNKGPILAALTDMLPGGARVLEIASGTGQHAAHFCAMRPDWSWQPSDAPAQSMAMLAARGAGLANCAAPLVVDVLAPAWPAALGSYDVVYCANMLHIAPWAACAGLMRLAAGHLLPGGLLIVYGPFFEASPTAPGNLCFDADLRARNPDWGLRAIDDVVARASDQGLALTRRIEMPANNLLLAFSQPGVTRGRA